MVALILLVIYILAWIHLVYRIRHGGKSPFGPGPYLQDDKVSFDKVSCAIILIGTLFIILMIIGNLLLMFN